MSLDLKSNFHQNNLNGVNSPIYKIYGFEDYRLDAEHRMLYRGGNEIPLTPKQTETLIALVENPGEIISKEVLMRRLWGNAAVEESNLIQNIYVLRKVLGDTSDGKPMIETLRRRGYRFNAEVAEHMHRLPEVSAGIRVADLESALQAKLSVGSIKTIRRESTPDKINDREVASDESPVQVEKPVNAYDAVNAVPVPTTRALEHRGLLVVSAAVLLFAVAFIYGVYRYYWGPNNPAAGTTRSIVILPVRPVNKAADHDLYEIGIADAIISRLNSVDGIVSRPISATQRYVNNNQDPLAAGREQKVDYVLAQNYQLSDGKIRVTAQLMNVSTGRTEGSFTIDREAPGAFAAQDAVAAEIVNRLATLFGINSTSRPGHGGTNNEEAYRYYLQGMNLSEERGVQNVQKALECLEHAVALDPKYALAWAGIAHLHRDIVGQTNSENREHYERSMEAIRKALDIDQNLSDAYSALCQNRNRYEYDAIGAEAACKRALELDPNSPQAHKTYTNFLYSRGRFDEAIDHIKTAMELQPVSYRNQQVYGLALLYARRYPEAEAQFRRLLELNPNHHYIHGQLALILELQGRQAEAFDYLIQKLIVKKADGKTIESFKAAYAKGGWRAVTIERIKNQEAETIPGSFSLACLYAKLGDKDKAFEFLEKAFQERSFLIAVIKVAPQLDPLRDDPRYTDLVNRIEHH